MIKNKKKEKDFLKFSKKIKRRRIIKKFLLIIIFILFILSTLVGFFYIPYFKIKKISVSGNKFLDTQNIINSMKASLGENFLFILPSENIFVFSKNKNKENLMNNFPRIKDVEIKKKFPDEISLNIIERKQTSLFCNADINTTNTGVEECAFVDENGYVYEKAPNFSDNLYLKFFDRRTKKQNWDTNIYFISQDQFKNLMELRDLLEKDGIKIKKINIEDGLYNLVTIDNWSILINERNQPASVVYNLNTVLDKIGEKIKKIDYIDFRLENKVYYKFR